MSNEDGFQNLNVQTKAFGELIDQFPNSYDHKQEINSASIINNKSPLNFNKNQNKANEMINETDVKKLKEVPYTQNDQVSPK